LKSNLNGKNKINAINTWAVSVLRYGAGIIRWTKEELRSLDRRTRKILTMIQRVMLIGCVVKGEWRPGTDKL